MPNETQTLVNVGIDIKDIPKIDDQEYSITLNAFFVVRWTDERMIIDQDKMESVSADDALKGMMSIILSAYLEALLVISF